VEEARAALRAAAAADGGAALQEALEAREAELANLQAALAGMSYEVEAADRLRTELRDAREGAATAARERDEARSALDGEGGPTSHPHRVPRAPCSGGQCASSFLSDFHAA
jgi:hypothetical protein